MRRLKNRNSNLFRHHITFSFETQTANTRRKNASTYGIETRKSASQSLAAKILFSSIVRKFEIRALKPVLPENMKINSETCSSTDG